VTEGTITLYGVLHGPQPLLLPGDPALWVVVLWTVIGFVMGSLPIAVVLARLVVHRDPREAGDHNPGAANAWRVPMFFGLVLCLLIVFVRLEDAWTLMLAWFLVLVYLLWAYPSAPVLVTGIANYGLLILRHRQDLHPPLFKNHGRKQ